MRTRSTKGLLLYIPAYGMIVLTLTLLLRPTGLMGRRFASGTHGKL